MKPSPSASTATPRVIDNDRDEITVTLNGRELRGYSYESEAERRAKMLAAREYVEGWFYGMERSAELLAALRDMAMAYGHPDDPDVIEWWEHRAEEAAEEGRDSEWYRNEARARAAAAIAKAEGGVK